MTLVCYTSFHTFLYEILSFEIRLAVQIAARNLSRDFLASEIMRSLVSADRIAETKNLCNNLFLDVLWFFSLSCLHPSTQITTQLCSFLLMAPRGPIPWTETIWIHSGNLFQATPLHQLTLQNPGNQISSQPIQKRWRLPGTPMSRLASNQTLSSETQIPLTDHQGLIQSSAFTRRHQSVLFAKAAQCPSWVLVTEGLRKYWSPESCL